ncbi:hypothetical protein BpHYR1_016652 [Brachionus plicatilis]|uniref:Uncharacterized protein n=1 Tax=Brachionus plicatilis TaxID=10195 RepID=A0A3M7RB52_BRAPC|nr:hypothetical protein BpHYR1_016652 [Brachionus plicatilis]
MNGKYLEYGIFKRIEFKLISKDHFLLISNFVINSKRKMLDLDFTLRAHNVSLRLKLFFQHSNI